MKRPRRSSRQQPTNNCGTDPSPQSPPEFFKVYIPAFNSHQLRVPSDFSKLCVPIPRKAVLREPNGRSWSVGMIENVRGLFIRSGWPEFVQDNALKYGDCLIFRYDRCSVFTVKIFGRNGCRIERRDSKRATAVKMEMQEEEMMKVKAKAGMETPPSLTRRCRRKRMILIQVQLEKSLHYVSCPSVNADLGTEALSGSTEAGSQVGDQTPDSTEGPVRPQHPHHMFSLKNWGFRQLNLSPRFLRLNGIKLKSELILSNERGEKWTAGVGTKTRGRLYLSSGWPKFLRDNGMQVNQRFVVEFIIDNKDYECRELRFSMVP